MTRQADPKVKDNIHVRARSETERRIIGELKQLALQDQVEIADLIFEGIDLMFKTHHWPPGNRARCHLTLEFPEHRDKALRNASRTTPYLKPKDVGNNRMVYESREYERLSMHTARQVLRNMVKATLFKIQSPGGKRWS
ncbi:MAG: hypothetical protein LBE76_05330 [Nitrososphaerota archaeon]|nr:hypothetical protein [Nitrososphaerota archaeon]